MRSVLICADDRLLLDRLSGRSIAVRLAATSDAAAAATTVGRHNSLYRLLVETAEPLAAVAPNGAWRGLSVDVIASSAGRFADLAGRLGAFRELGVTICLPVDDKALADARTLSSLGIRTRLMLDGGTAPDWEQLSDLMTYALLGLVVHAPIEPFQTIADTCRMDSRTTDWSPALFDDPLHFLHLDAEGRIALSRRDLLAGQFVGDLSALDSPALADRRHDRAEAWRRLFLDDHFCSRCPGWRLCRGRHAAGKPAADGCATFFAELADVIEQRAGLRPERRSELSW